MSRLKMPSLAWVIVLSTLVVVMSARSETARAGDYSVKQCLGSSFQGFFGEYDLLGTDRIDVVAGCLPSSVSKVGIYQDRSGSSVPFGSGGQFLWVTPASVGIYGTSITAKLFDANNFEAELTGASNSWPNVDLDGGSAHDAQSRTSSWTNRSQPQSLIIARLSCRRNDGCSNRADGPKAFFEITDMEFRSNDRVAPTVTGSGVLWDIGNSLAWHRGSIGFQVAARDDGSGVASSYLLINNLRVDLPAISCPGAKVGYATSFTPCPTSANRSGTANTATAPFQEGGNSVQFCTQDYATVPAGANHTCTSPKLAFIDNLAPGPPLQMGTVGGEDWRHENGFRVEWQNPTGQRSPITHAEFRVVRTLDGTLVESGTVSVGATPTVGPITLPQAGEYRVEVKLRDSAGNTGSAASTMLRFDDGRPGDVSPEAPSGWISEDELPLEQTIEQAEAGGPSGVEGYAVEVSRESPASPCPTGECSSDELTLTDGADQRTATIQNLAEGSHWISAVAASGASLASRNIGATLVRVDKTVPEVKLSGVPQGWVNEPVTLTALASDSGSGMENKPGTDDGNPVTVIRSGDEAPYVAPGETASFTVAEEGKTSVTFWARDLAGNTNDGALLPGGEFHPRPGTATVRIDRRKPSVALNIGSNTNDPEVVTATVRDADSGPASGAIFIRGLSTGGEKQELATEFEEGTMVARIPSDELPAGRYQLLAEVTDRAGNAGTTSGSGSVNVVTLPLKSQSKLTLNFSKRSSRSRSLRLGHGKTVDVAGRLSGVDERALDGARVRLEQTFMAGSRQRVVVTETRTDGNGQYVFTLKAGPSRSFRVLYQGSRTMQPATSRDLKLVVKDRVIFKIKPKVMRNGGKALMVGSVRGRGAMKPARGKLVAIQYFDPSRGRWRPVEVLRASRSGRFKYEYRFRTISYAQRILFRAVSLPESGWPFKPSTSRRQSVIVYPKG